MSSKLSRAILLCLFGSSLCSTAAFSEDSCIPVPYPNGAPTKKLSSDIKSVTFCIDPALEARFSTESSPARPAGCPAPPATTCKPATMSADKLQFTSDVVPDSQQKCTTYYYTMEKNDGSGLVERNTCLKLN